MWAATLSNRKISLLATFQACRYAAPVMPLMPGALLAFAWKIAVRTSSSVTGVHSASSALGSRLNTGGLVRIGGGGSSAALSTLHLSAWVMARSAPTPRESGGEGYCRLPVVHFLISQKVVAVAFLTTSYKCLF